jgi:hypothetical protein
MVGRLMVPITDIKLIARRQSDLGEGRPDYLVHVQDRLVGRVYCQLSRPDVEQWFWGVQGVITSMEIGQLHGSLRAWNRPRPSCVRRSNFGWCGRPQYGRRTYPTAGYKQDLRDVGAPDAASPPTAVQH